MPFLVAVLLAVVALVVLWDRRLRPAASWRARPGAAGQCWRCGRRPAAARGRCRRCGASGRRVRRTVLAARRRLADPSRVGPDTYLRHELELAGSGPAALLGPAALAVAPGDEIELVFDRRGRLRALDVVSRDAGWRLAPRVHGERPSRRVVAAVVALAALALVVPAWVAAVGGEAPARLALVAAAGALVLAALAAALRPRVRVNRDVLAAVAARADRPVSAP